jgi:hypothetical protein
VKGDGHIVFASDGERIADELARFIVGHLKTEGSDRETQFAPGVSGRADCAFHVVNERLELTLAKRKKPGRRLWAGIAMKAGHDLSLF